MTHNLFQAQRSIIDTALLNSSKNQTLIEEYLSWKKSYSKSAHRSYRLWVVKFQTFVNKMPEDLKYTDYVAFASQLVDNYSPRCIQYALSIVHNYLKFFLHQGRLRFPLYLARIPFAAAESHKPVAEEDYRRMVAALRFMNPMPLRDLTIIMMLHDTGLRVALKLRRTRRWSILQEDCEKTSRAETTRTHTAPESRFSALPPRKRARVNPELAGEFLLRHAERFAMIDQTMRQSVSILKRIESETPSRRRPNLKKCPASRVSEKSFPGCFSTRMIGGRDTSKIENVRIDAEGDRLV